MQAFYAESFDREMGCAEKEWLGWLPQAMGAHPYQLIAQALSADIDGGRDQATWASGRQAPLAASRQGLRYSLNFAFSQGTRFPW